ncbi:mitochondrial carrier [Clavulina sp. PMI_390]|nr:mitochondrial carrier [Clavulina sp. PMI_390]
MSPNASSSSSSTLVIRNSSAFAGAGAGLVSSIITCPLDVIKTRLQAQKAARGRIDYLGVFGLIKHIWLRDGVRGYYRGLGPTILGYIPTWAIYFSVYDGLKRQGGEGYGEHHAVKSEAMALHISAAMTAGATSSLLTHPIWVVKTRFMTQPSQEVRYRHTLDAFVRIYRSDGIHAFYRGLIPSLFGVTHVAVQFPLYEELKLRLADRQNIPVTSLSSPALFICSSISKMVATLVTYPHEVIRTRLQIDYSHSHQHSGTPPHPNFSTVPKPGHALSLRALWYTTSLVWHENGWRGMYRGISINLLRTVPNSVITLITYEQIMRYFMLARSDPPLTERKAQIKDRPRVSD